MSSHSMSSLTKQDCFIEGHWVPTEKRFAVTNPANGEVITEVADADGDLTKRAINAAEVALAKWRATSTQERAALLRKWYQAIMDNKQALGELMSAEQGKPVPEAVGEVEYGASFVDWFAGEAERINGDILPITDNSKRVIDQTTGRRMRRHHALELPERNDHAQSRACVGSWLHHRC